MSEAYIVAIREDGQGFEVLGPGRGDWRVMATCERKEDAERIADAFTTKPGVPTYASLRAAKGSDGEEVRSLPVGGARSTQAGGDSGGMPLSVGRSRPDKTATLSIVTSKPE